MAESNVQFRQGELHGKHDQCGELCVRCVIAGELPGRDTGDQAACGAAGWEQQRLQLRLQRQHDRAHGGRRDLHPGLRCGEPREAGKHGASGYTYDADDNRVKAVIGSSTTGGLLPRMARIATKAEARFVQISEIRGRESGAVFCHELHELTRKDPEIRSN